MTPQLMLSILILYLLFSLVLATTYLLRRRLTPGEWLFWSLAVIFLPVFGPFVVIAARPGLPPLKPRKPTHP